jgi:ribosomal protein S4
MFNKKNRFRPLYKQFIKLRENVQNRKKFLKFKSKKWEKPISFYKNKLKRYKKFKPKDQTRYIVSKYAIKALSYKKNFRNTLNSSRNFRLFYGNLSKKFLKKQINQLFSQKKNRNKNFKLLFLKLFEQRLDTVLYRSKFCFSLRNARQLIVHRKIYVNKNLIKTPSYILKTGDLINIDLNYYKLIENNLRQAQIWPIPPKYLSINYKTLEILFHGNIEYTNTSTNFMFHFNLEKILSNYLNH